MPAPRSQPSRLAARALGAAAAIRSPRGPGASALGPAFFSWEPSWYERGLNDVRILLGDGAETEVATGSEAPESTIDELLARTGA